MECGSNQEFTSADNSNKTNNIDHSLSHSLVSLKKNSDSMAEGLFSNSLNSFKYNMSSGESVSTRAVNTTPVVEEKINSDVADPSGDYIVNNPETLSNSVLNINNKEMDIEEKGLNSNQNFTFQLPVLKDQETRKCIGDHDKKLIFPINSNEDLSNINYTKIETPFDTCDNISVVPTEIGSLKKATSGEMEEVSSLKCDTSVPNECVDSLHCCEERIKTNDNTNNYSCFENNQDAQSIKVFGCNIDIIDSPESNNTNESNYNVCTREYLSKTNILEIDENCEVKENNNKDFLLIPKQIENNLNKDDTLSSSTELNGKPTPLELKVSVPNYSKALPNDVTSLSLMLSACSIDSTNGEGIFSSKVDMAFSELDMRRLEDIFDSHKDETNSYPEDIVISNSLRELYKNGRGLSLDDESLLGFASTLTSELEKNLYSSSLGLEDIINAAVNEIGLEFSQDKELQDQLMSLDSDSNMATASEGIISSCSPSASSEASQQVSEASSSNCSLAILPETSQDSSPEDGLSLNEEKEEFDKRLDGCLLSNLDDTKLNKDSNSMKTSYPVGTGNEIQAIIDSSCSCQRPDVIPHEENGSVLMGAWNELRSSLRQLHRSVVPSSLTKSGLSNPRNRPSINRIKALSNMLLAHDPHQLFTRVNQLSQELCIELKVRLLATIHDRPEFDEACTFIQALCESYEWVISVCEAIQSAFEKLDVEYLSGFGLNWMTVNMHTFYATIFTDPDVQDYLNLCTSKAEEFDKGHDTMGCLASLKRTLTVAEGVWCRAERSLQEYAMERAAFNAQRRQLLSEWGQLKSRHPSYNKYSSHSKGNLEVVECTASALEENILQKCPCHSCHSSVKKELPVTSNILTGDKLSSEDLIEENDLSNGSCECHFCNSSSAQAQASNGVLSSSNSSVLPPLTQPQLSLYPHIHGTTVGSDIISNSCLDDLGPLSGTPAVKPPIFANPYLGSDLLTEQLIREWDLVYGDTLTPPSFNQPFTSSNKGHNVNDLTLINNLEKVNLNSRPSYTRQLQQPDDQSRISPTYSHSINLASNSDSCDAGIVPPPILPGQCSESTKLIDISNQQCSGVTTHNLNCKGVNSIVNDTPKHRMVIRSSERSSSRESPSDIDTTDPDEWSSGDESDASGSSTTHQGAHCDCCYCHMLQNMPGGGRQKYSDRRDRLLKILSHKKKTTCTSTNPDPPSPTTSTGVCAGLLQQQQQIEKDKAMGQQTVDEIMNYIEGKRTGTMCHKKAAKKARQKERKLAMKKQEEGSRKKSSSSSSKSSYHREDDFDEDEDDELDYYDDESEELIEEEEDGPLAELRRRAPDVTITVVKPGHQQGLKGPNSQKYSNNDMNSGSRHPLVAKSTSSTTSQANNTWAPPRTTLSSGRLSGSGMPLSSSIIGKDSSQPSSSASGGLSSLMKGMDVLGKDQDKDNKGSQMVTIRRIMDPVSSEPTVTITLKGEEPKKDKVLFKLVNGQACQGDNSQNKGPSKPVPKVKKPQEKPVYDIPEGLDPEEIKKLKKKQKKERQKQRKEIEKVEEQKQEQLKQVQLQKQQEYLKQQEAAIKKQQEAIQRQQEELSRQQKKGMKGNKNKDKKGKGCGNDKEAPCAKSKNVAAMVYDKDDVARNFNLPPGVSINKVAGQPGMVTISNTMGNPFTQPFLPNPNMYPNPVIQSYNLGGSQGYPMGSPSNSTMGYPGIYGGCGGSTMPWNEAIDPCTGAPQESVIVVDTKTGATKSNSNSQFSRSNQNFRSSFKTFDEMTSEDKIEAAVRGEVDASLLNITQKKKYKKALKALKEEEENAVLKQREEDELMDRMYEMAKGQIPSISTLKDSKSNKAKGCSKAKGSSKAVSTQISINSTSNGSSGKGGQQAKSKQKQNNLPASSKKGIDKSNSKVDLKIVGKNQPEQQKVKLQQKEIPKKQQETQKKLQVKTEVQQKQPNPKVNSSKMPPTQQLTQKKPQLLLNLKKEHVQQDNPRKEPQSKMPKNLHALSLPNQQKIPQTQQKIPQTQQKLQQNKQQKLSLTQQQNAHQKSPQTNLQHKSLQQNVQKPQLQPTKVHQEKQPAIQKLQVVQPVLQREKQATNQKPTIQTSLNITKKSQHISATITPLTKNEPKPNIKAHPNLRGSPAGKENVYSYGPSVGYTATDIGHEARYAQYLAANASTLASVEFETSQMQKSASTIGHGIDGNLKKGKKRGKRGNLEDMTTIDSVFTPKDGPGGELDDETDREVEAFKRFCLYNVPRNAGEKPKVNFNVKDIMIKKKH